MLSSGKPGPTPMSSMAVKTTFLPLFGQEDAKGCWQQNTSLICSAVCCLAASHHHVFLLTSCHMCFCVGVTPICLYLVSCRSCRPAQLVPDVLWKVVDIHNVDSSNSKNKCHYDNNSNNTSRNSDSSDNSSYGDTFQQVLGAYGTCLVLSGWLVQGHHRRDTWSHQPVFCTQDRVQEHAWTVLDSPSRLALL